MVEVEERKGEERERGREGGGTHTQRGGRREGGRPEFLCTKRNPRTLSFIWHF